MELVRNHLSKLHYQFLVPLLLSELHSSLLLLRDESPSLVDHHALRKGQFFGLRLWLQLQSLVVERIKSVSVLFFGRGG